MVRKGIIDLHVRNQGNKHFWKVKMYTSRIYYVKARSYL